jgi:integrase/recombinase XerD
LEAPDLNTPYGIRDRALLEVFYATGLRRNEVLKLTPADLDRKSGIVWVNQGKGKKDREVPIAFSTLEWVAHYEAEVREHWISKGKNENQLFLNNRGKPLTRYSCNDRVLQYVRQVAPNKKGSCHLIRHSISTHLLERGCHIRFIQEILGHTSLSSTQRYAQVRIMHLREAYKRYHPSMKKK